MKDTMYIGNSKSLAQGGYTWSIITEQLFLSLRQMLQQPFGHETVGRKNQNCSLAMKIH